MPCPLAYGEAMRPRDFIILGGFSVAWPLATRAQQTAKLRTIGFLGAGRASGYGKLADAFATRMRELGWVEGSTIAINYRWAEGNAERLVDIATEFVRLKVDVIVTNGNVAIAAAKRATSQIPIVFAGAGDPVGGGLVASPARPGGNVTGMSLQEIDTAGKRLEMLREVIPNLRRLAIVANSSNSSSALELRGVQKAADTFGLEAISLDIQRAEQITPALAGGSSTGTAPDEFFATNSGVRLCPVRISTSSSASSMLFSAAKIRTRRGFGATG
jgi:putative tryptophan/tyrosine transport system substrate-binding protein